MQIKNIILTIAASVALVHASPECPASYYDLCIDEVDHAIQSVVNAKLPEGLNPAIECAKCFLGAVIECAPTYVEGTLSQKGGDEGKWCYVDSMRSCKGIILKSCGIEGY